MDKIKVLLAIVGLAIISMNALTQSAAYEEVVKGFQNSYLNEATGNLQAAVQDLKSIYDEDSYEINLRLGWLTYSAGLFTESQSYYNRAVDLKPFAIEPRFGLIYPTAAMGNWKGPPSAIGWVRITGGMATPPRRYRRWSGCCSATSPTWRW